VQADEGVSVRSAKRLIAKRICVDEDVVSIRYEDGDVLLDDDTTVQRDAVALVRIKVCNEHISCEA
jgi:hypothetical protein